MEDVKWKNNVLWKMDDGKCETHDGKNNRIHHPSYLSHLTSIP